MNQSRLVPGSIFDNSRLAELDQNGYAIFQEFLSANQLVILSSEAATFTDTNVRNLLRKSALIREFVGSRAVLQLAREVLGSSARAVKATLFDKTPRMNWKVPPHQDVTIVVQNKAETSGFGPWTEKDGFHNVQPPASVLEQMISLRFHLDDCDNNNGSLKVWPGSHRHGRLGDTNIQQWIDEHDGINCPVPAGGILLMRPLIIHASAAAKVAKHRRVLHVDFAMDDLPNGLKWLDEIM